MIKLVFRMNKELLNIVGENNLVDGERVKNFIIDGKAPKYVVFPENINQISEIVKFASKENLKVIPCGNKTKLHIGNIPSKVDLLLSMANMNRIIEFNSDDLTASCESGIKLLEFNKILSEKNLFLPVDPPFVDNCTIGGITATDSSGPLRLKYGKLKDMIMGMKIVLADSSIVKTGVKVVKNSSGYNLSRIYCGSLGTIGIITEVNFKLSPLPESQKNTLICFENMENLINFCYSIRDSFLIPSYMEYLSPSFTRFLPNKLIDDSCKNYHICFLGFDGFSETVDWQLEQVKNISSENNCKSAYIPCETGDSILYQIRNFYTIFPNSVIFKISYVIPKFETLLNKIKNLLSENKMEIILLSHFGSGIMYLVCPLMDNENEENKIITFIHKLDEIVFNSDGNFMIEKIPLKFKEKVSVWGKVNNNLKIMKKIKEQFDPQNIFNPNRFIGRI